MNRFTAISRAPSDVRARKAGIVSGQTLVHGAKYALADWGIRQDTRVSSDDIKRSA
jgi:hypothetical protein